MWITYKFNSRRKKFSIPKGSPVPKTIKDPSGSIWELDDSKYLGSTEVKKEEPSNDKLKLEGYAVLIKDPISGLRLWATYNDQGQEHVNLSPMQPLVIPTESNFELGTRIEIKVPK